MDKLLKAIFIREVRYSTWLANVGMVKKVNGKWRMCIDYIDMNMVCPKDAYPLPNINRLIDKVSRFQVLSFLDAYSEYNQIGCMLQTRRKRHSSLKMTTFVQGHALQPKKCKR